MEVVDISSSLPEFAARWARTVEKTRQGGLPAPFAATPHIRPGSGQACSGCGERIEPTEREFETSYSNALTFRFHSECYRAWTAFRRGPSAVTGLGPRPVRRLRRNRTILPEGGDSSPRG
jgi:hypothetical protein